MFKLDPSGVETVLYSFAGGTDGANPQAGVIRDAAGNLYGTTVSGGDTSCNAPSGCGTVFKLDASGVKTTLYSFMGGTDGANPIAGVLRDAAGNFYGTTEEGGGGTLCNDPLGCGTVFKLDASGVETTLYGFTGGTDGAFPDSGLIRDAAGNLYGTTVSGGDTSCHAPSGCGTVFKLDVTGKETVLRSFTNGTDGANPFNGVIRDAAGNLYGTAEAGGSFSFGVVFKLNATGKETVLHAFTGGADGAQPVAGLIADAAGNLYGATANGGALSGGVVFKLSPK